MITSLMLFVTGTFVTNVLESGSVRIEKTSQGCSLTRNGKRFMIKGAGGNGSLKMLKECGGNAIRTWGADDLGRQLDDAQKHGLTVVAGIWLLHPDGMDYRDRAKVLEQKERCEQIILKYRHHPALLMWSFGNETEGFGSETDPEIWKAIEEICASSKKLDAEHPTMTVIAEVGGNRVPSINKYCPSLDVVGINSYGGGPTVVKRYREAGGVKPVVLTEFGPPGAWEVGKTEWGAPYELSSTQKADFYRDTYQKSVLGQSDLCLGSFAFLWSSKIEATPTWFGMFLADGRKVAAVDEMTKLWSGTASKNLCPKVEPINSPGNNRYPMGSTVRFTCDVSDPEGDAGKAEWYLCEEVKPHPPGVDAPAPVRVDGAVLRSNDSSATVRMPEKPGLYRLYLVVGDKAGGAATANVPILVEART